MGAFVIAYLSSLLLMSLITPFVWAGRFHKQHKQHKNGDSSFLRAKGNTGKHYKEYNPGIQTTVSFLPYRNCYRKFFAGNKPPEGLRPRIPYNSKIRYICQKVVDKQNSQYGTMFDENLGIAVFSAYTLTADNIAFQHRSYPDSWAKTPGIHSQGSDAVYPSLPYIKAQLAPALTLSNTGENDDGWLSTFTYTNAVPQRPGFNLGMWFEFEHRIRLYAKDECIPNGGALYLLSGTSFVHSEPEWPNWPKDPKKQPWLADVKNNYLLPENPPIAIPVSLWTAGCCMNLKNSKVIGNFAVIGNNEEDEYLMHAREVSVEQLQGILKQDDKVNGQPSKVELFPALKDCSKESKQITLPEDSSGFLMLI